MLRDVDGIRRNQPKHENKQQQQNKTKMKWMFNNSITAKQKSEQKKKWQMAIFLLITDSLQRNEMTVFGWFFFFSFIFNRN